MYTFTTPNLTHLSTESPRPLRAIVEVIDGELVIYKHNPPHLATEKRVYYK
jgi:hypothetical protein